MSLLSRKFTPNNIFIFGYNGHEIFPHKNNTKKFFLLKIFLLKIFFQNIIFAKYSFKIIYFIMSDNLQSYKAFGKCCHVESGERCGCQRFSALENDEKNCEACFHHSSFHEDLIKNNNNRLLNNRIPSFNESYNNSTDLSNNQQPTINTGRQRISTLDELNSPYNSNITSNASILNQLLSGQALEEKSIANELNETFTKNRNYLPNSSTLPSIGMHGMGTPNFNSFLASNYYNKNKKRKNVNVKIKETCITVIVLPDIGDDLQTPMISQPM